MAADPRIVALGEPALTNYYQQETKAQQQASFRERIRTGEDARAILREEQVGRLRRCAGRSYRRLGDGG